MLNKMTKQELQEIKEDLEQYISRKTLMAEFGKSNYDLIEKDGIELCAEYFISKMPALIAEVERLSG